MAVMVVMVLLDVDKVEGVVRVWHEAGCYGITIVESSGAMHLPHAGPRDDLPMFPSLHSLLAHQDVNHRTLFSVVSDDVNIEALFDATEDVVGNLMLPNKGLLAAIPVLSTRGLRRPTLGR